MRIILAAIFLLAPVLGLFAQGGAGLEHPDVAALIRSLPTTEEFCHDCDIAVHSPLPGVDEQQRKDARMRAEKARTGYDQLYHLLRVDASVFDYPGLLALNRDPKSRPDGTFSVEIGTWLFGWPDYDKYTAWYIVRYNKAGIITKIQRRYINF